MRVMLLALVVAALVPACSSDSAPATFTEVYDALYPVQTKAQCNQCHSLPPNQVSNGNLHMGMDRETAYTALVGKSSASDKCSGHMLVMPGQPDASLLYLKVSGTPPCGSRMPLGGQPLSDEQLALVRSWIANGAQDD